MRDSTSVSLREEHVAHTLLAITGMSPAVVTETLYAIAMQKAVWPNRLCIVTTAMGAERIEEKLHTTVAALCMDYDMPPIPAEAIDICVVPGADGVPVADARSLEDHEALGDFLIQKVRDLTADSSTTVHASIAGGRKTMTYYLGYAVSLFGRSEDTLSHVLVSESFEGVGDFWYPTPYEESITGRNGIKLDCKDAKVTLADIPFIRLRNQLPKILLELEGHLRFRDLVAMINLGEQECDQRQLNLRLPADRPVLLLDNGQGRELAEIELSPLNYLFYRTLIRLSFEEETSLGQSPGKSKEEADTDLAELLLEEWVSLAKLKISGYNDMMLSQRVDKLAVVDLVDDLTAPFHLSRKSVLSLKPGMLNTWFNQRCNEIKSDLEKQLPSSLSRWLTLRQVADSDRQWWDFYQPEWPTGAKRGYYGIPLSRQRIILEEPDC